MEADTGLLAAYAANTNKENKGGLDMAGKSIYFTETELWWILWSMQNQDGFEGNEKFEKANDDIKRKVEKALED